MALQRSISSLMATVLLLSVISVIMIGQRVSATEAAAVPKKKTFPVPPDHPFIKHVTGQIFREEVVDPTIPVVIEFFKPRDKASKMIAPEYEAAAEALQGFMTFKVMNAQSDEGAGVAQMFGIQSFPSIVLFNPQMHPVAGGEAGQYMKLPLGYSGPGTAESIVKWALEAMEGEQIEILEDDHDLAVYINKFVQFDLPKFLLFSEDDVTSPAIKSLSHQFRYRAMFAVVPSSAKQLIARYEVTSFPTLMAVTSMGEDTEYMPDPENANLATMKEFVSKFALTADKSRQIQGVFMEEDIKQKKKEEEEAKAVKAQRPILIDSPEAFTKYCLKRKKGNCIAAFVDGGIHNQETLPFEMLFNVTKNIIKRSQTDVQAVIVDGLYNYELVNFLEMTNGLPDVAFIVPKTKRFHNMIGSFSEKSITSFYLDKVGKVSGKRLDVAKAPKWVESPMPEAEEQDEEAEL